MTPSAAVCTTLPCVCHPACACGGCGNCGVPGVRPIVLCALVPVLVLVLVPRSGGGVWFVGCRTVFRVWRDVQCAGDDRAGGRIKVCDGSDNVLLWSVHSVAAGVCVRLVCSLAPGTRCHATHLDGPGRCNKCSNQTPFPQLTH